MEEIKNENEIKLLNFPDNVRTRPSTYVGGLECPDNIFREVIDNSMDESYASSCDKIYIHQNFNGFHLVADNGRGLPIYMSSDIPDITQAEVATSKLHAGSKFVSTGVNRVGMNGLGIKATNALSESFIVFSKINKDNYNKSTNKVKEVWESAGPRSKSDLYYVIMYSKGIKIAESAGKLKDLSKKLWKDNYRDLPEGYSTYVLFIPDPEIWDSVKTRTPNKNLQYFMLIQEKFNKKKVEVIANDKSLIGTFQPYKFETIRTIIPKDSSKNKQVRMYATFEVDANLGGRETEGSINSLVVNQGHHIQIFEACFKDALIRNYGLSHTYYFNGLKCVVICLAEELLWNSQTKESCKSIAKVKSTDFDDVTKDIVKIFKSNSDYWDIHVQRLNAYADSMVSLSTMDRIKRDLMKSVTAGGIKGKAFLPDKLSDATAGSKERMKCELFLTEGNSAGGSLKSGRKSTLYHAVMPLKGRTLNTIDKTADQMLDNKELNTVFQAIGLGIDSYNIASDAKTNEEKWEIIKKHARYGKIIISTDADDDGFIIAAVLIATFAKFARFLIDFGMLYTIESPIYEQSGRYFFPSDKDSEGNIQGFNPSKPYVRFKGLGELNSNQVYDSFYDESKRRLIRITPEGMDKALELVRSIDERKKLLTENGILTNPYNLK